MSKIFKKITGSSRIVLTIKMDLLELMGGAVADKDMFCVHWSMKGLRGRESTGDTENVRAAISDGVSYPVARFNDVFSGEIHAKARKDGGYEPAEFEMRVVCPALHKKDEKMVGRATINIFEKVPALAAGQSAHQAEQTIPVNKEGNAVAHVRYTLAVKSDAPVEETEATEPEEPTSPTTVATESSGLLVKTPPATPQKETGSEMASSGTSDLKEESESKSRHRKRHSSSNTAALNAQLKKKEEELQQKDEEIKQLQEELKKKDEELKQKDEEALAKHKEISGQLAETRSELSESRKNSDFLESRVKELEQAKESTDVVPLDPAQEKMRDDLARLQSDKERLEDEKMHLADALEEARKEIEELRSRPAVDSNQKQELELLNQQLALLQEELSKAKQEMAAPDSAAPAKSGMMMQAIFAAVGAVLGIIIGHFI